MIFARMKIYLILFVVGSAILGAGVLYYKDTQARIQQLAENNAKLSVAAERQEATINQMKETAVRQAELNDELRNRLQEAEVYKDELLSKLQDHDLTRLALKKPGLIESRINNGTKELFDDLESSTRD